MGEVGRLISSKFVAWQQRRIGILKSAALCPHYAFTMKHAGGVPTRVAPGLVIVAFSIYSARSSSPRSYVAQSGSVMEDVRSSG